MLRRLERRLGRPGSVGCCGNRRRGRVQKHHQGRWLRAQLPRWIPVALALIDLRKRRGCCRRIDCRSRTRIPLVVPDVSASALSAISHLWRHRGRDTVWPDPLLQQSMGALPNRRRRRAEAGRAGLTLPRRRLSTVFSDDDCGEALRDRTATAVVVGETPRDAAQGIGGDVSPGGLTLLRVRCRW